MNPYNWSRRQLTRRSADGAQSTLSKIAMAVVVVAFGLLLLWAYGVI